MNLHIDIQKANNGSAQPGYDHTAGSDAVIVKPGKLDGYPFFEDVKPRPGLRMIACRYSQSENYRMAYEIEHSPLIFSYNLSQKIRLTINSGTRSRKVVERLPGSGALCYLPRSHGIVESVGPMVAGVALYLSLSAFRELFGSYSDCLEELGISRHFESSEKLFFQQNVLSESTCLVLRQILSCPYRGELRKLFYEAKSLELVALWLSEMNRHHIRNPLGLSRRDKERVAEAYNILLARLDHPPGLNDLSRLAGINRNKLNLGFKNLYGDTVFNVLRNTQLLKAWSLLLQTDLSLSEIALSVGYSNQSNFTTAFRRRFGKTPNTVRRESLGHTALRSIGTC